MQMTLLTLAASNVQTKKGWSEEEIQLLHQWRHERVPLKIMAHRLGRTITSVNKKVLRSGLKFSRSLPVKRKLPMRSYCKEKERNDRVTARWVHLKDAIAWMSRKGHRIVPIPQQNLYRMDGALLLPHQLLLATNKERIAKGYPIFCVHDITEI